MIFNCKSGSSPHCDCVQSITVEKVDAFLELKIFKNNCSTKLRMHFQPHDYMNSYILDFTTYPSHQYGIPLAGRQWQLLSLLLSFDIAFGCSKELSH